MSRPIDLSSAILPAPVKGANFIDPLASMDQQTSPWLCNVDCENRSVRVRNGYRIHCDIRDALATQTSVFGLGTYGTGSTAKMFAYSQGGGTCNVIDVSTTAPTLAFATGLFAPDEAQPINFGSKFMFVNETADQPAYYNGAAWAASTLTVSGSPIFIQPMLYYKGRLFYVSTRIYYGDVGQVAGAIDVNPSFNISEVYQFNASTAWIAAFSLSDGLVNQDYIAFGNDVGEVLVYTGDYPNDPNWQIVGRFKIGKPISFSGRYGPVIPYQNDTLILTVDGVTSLRQLFSEGNTDGTKNSISRAINKYWSKLFETFPTNISNPINLPSGAYSDRERKVYILVQGFVDEDNTLNTSQSTMFVLNTDSGAWSVHKITENDGSRGAAGVSGPGMLTYFNGDIYYACRLYIFKLDRTSLLDQDIDSEADIGYTFQIHSAPTSYGDTVSTKKQEFYEPIIKQESPRNPVTIKCTVDMGRKTSGTVSITNTASVNKRPYSVGEEGTFFQYKLEGSTAAVTGSSPGAIELYAVNSLYKKGGVL